MLLLLFFSEGQNLLGMFHDLVFLLIDQLKGLTVEFVLELFDRHALDSGNSLVVQSLGGLFGVDKGFLGLSLEVHGSEGLHHLLHFGEDQKDVFLDGVPVKTDFKDVLDLEEFEAILEGLKTGHNGGFDLFQFDLSGIFEKQGDFVFLFGDLHGKIKHIGLEDFSLDIVQGDARNSNLLKDLLGHDGVFVPALLQVALDIFLEG